MKDYILYSLPLDFAKECDSEAIDNKNYFKVRVRHVEGNTFQILSVLNNTSACVFCSPGTQLELHQMKYLRKYYHQLKWHKVDTVYRKCWILPIPRIELGTLSLQD
jgi:hypothetical protein